MIKQRKCKFKVGDTVLVPLRPAIWPYWVCHSRKRHKVVKIEDLGASTYVVFVDVGEEEPYQYYDVYLQ